MSTSEAKPIYNRELMYKNSIGNTTNRFEYEQLSSIGYVVVEGIFFDTISLELCRNVMEFSRSNKMRGLIFDILKMKGTFAKLMNFFKDEFVPQMGEHGCSKIGVVLDNNFFALFAMQQLLKLLNKGAEVRVFKNMSDCEQWILNYQ